jgi:hypothetical protein
MRYHVRACVVFFFCSLVALGSAQTDGQVVRTISILNRISSTYLGARADFGDTMEDKVTVNIMYPPSDNINLCNFPSSILNATANNDYLLDDATTPIALFVSRDRCSPQRKALIALKVANYTGYPVKYLIVYSTFPQDNDELYRLQPDRNVTSDEMRELLGIGLVFIPYRYGAGIDFAIQDTASATGISPIFYQSGSQQWNLYAQIQRYSGTNNGFGDYGHNDNPADFYWFRFVLFGLLIAAPCLRAGYLWYAGGGRIHFRRNERGRIVGLQVTP